MLGALYVDFGLYVTVKFKAQVLLNLIKYEPTLYDDEFPLLTAGVQQNVYDFALEPDEDDVMYVWDDDANSTNGISMDLPEIYRTMKRMGMPLRTMWTAGMKAWTNLLILVGMS